MLTVAVNLHSPIPTCFNTGRKFTSFHLMTFVRLFLLVSFSGRIFFGTFPSAPFVASNGVTGGVARRHETRSFGSFVASL
jgi:hypothetical protein